MPRVLDYNIELRPGERRIFVERIAPHAPDDRVLVEVPVDVPELRRFLRGHARLEAELERALAAPPPRGRIR